MSRALVIVKRQRGFNLVELMVAMGLSLVLLAGALSILYSSKVTNAENERIGRLQEAGRTVVELILRDARASGFVGCARPQPSYFSNLLNNPTSLLWNVDVSMQGFETTRSGTGWTPALPALVRTSNGTAPTAGSDILALRTAREGLPVFRLASPLMNRGDPLDIRRDTNETIAVGSTLVVGDCSGASAFAVTSFAPVGADRATVGHAQGALNSRGSLGHSYRSGALVTPIDTVIYFVAPSESGEGPSLWRIVGNNTAQELVEGVENIQVLYGTGGGGLNAISYDTAAVVDASPRGWNDVVSLSISVLIRSPGETNLERDQRSYQLLDQTIPAAGDRRQRSVFTTTVTLRNRSS